MMKIFNYYAHYYDLIYRDKNYGAEVEFIKNHLLAYAPNAKSILELGSGTGIHAFLLAESGYEVRGVDISEQMLARACDRLVGLPPELAAKLEFSPGDVCSINLNQQFDVAIALFHVINYQTTNTRLQSFFQTIKNHLKPEGIIVFDFWYGPAVLSDRPSIRVKRLENDEVSIIRIAEPVMYPKQNLVEVNYQVLITDKISGHVQELKESHQMRYLFMPEIELLLENVGMEVIKLGEWMSDRPTGFDTWNGYCVAKFSN
jgi:SAM-dependent methyltransferase